MDSVLAVELSSKLTPVVVPSSDVVVTTATTTTAVKPLVPSSSDGFFSTRPRFALVLSFSLPFLALFLAFTLFSLYTVLMKKALNEGTSPLVIALLREILATCVLLPAAYFNERRLGTIEQFWPKAEHHTSFIFLGLVMIWGVQLLSAMSLEHLSANTYALLAPTVPVLCAAVAILTGYEHFDRKSSASWTKIAAVLIAVVGAAIIAVGAYVSSSAKDKGNTALGLLLLGANKVCVATYPVMEKKLMKTYRPLTIVAWGYTTGAVLVILSVLPCAMSSASLWSIGRDGWVSICFSAFVTSSFNYALMAEVNKRTSPLTVMSFYPVQSIMTPILSAALLSAPLNASDGFGGTVIVVGLFALAFARWRESGGVSVTTEGKIIHNGHEQLINEASISSPPTAMQCDTCRGKVEWGYSVVVAT
jgi:drug/metabolite transporter (DMT)-like permease